MTGRQTERRVYRVTDTETRTHSFKRSDKVTGRQTEKPGNSATER